MGTARRCTILVAVVIFCAAGTALGARTVGEPIDIAPDVENSQFQKWPSAAWSAGANCWLVVWREGDLNRQTTDIMCARLAADGTPMDPAGVPVSTAEGVQDRPVVASDGKDFLVVWQDFRNGKDTSTGSAQGWDVYAARVSADGRVQDTDGLRVAGGPHNQCYPALVHAGSHYVVAWQSWVEDAVIPKLGSYEARGARISSDGTLLDTEGVVLMVPTACKPALGYHPDGGLVLVAIGHKENKRLSGGVFFNWPCFQRLDPEKIAPVGSPSYFDRKSKDRVGWDRGYPPAIAVMKDGSTLVTTPGDKGGMTCFRYDKDGTRVGDAHRFRDDNKNQSVSCVQGMASDGERTLMTFDFPTDKKVITLVKGRMAMKVWGWMVSPDGKLLEGGDVGIPIANKADVDSVQGRPCVGPDGTFLVVHGEMRDEGYVTRVVGRVVK